jgi:hypothetical protein
LTWKKDGVNGTSIRNIQAVARAMTEKRQDVLKSPALRMISWAIAKAIKIGQLPPSDDWFRWDLTMPPKLSIDPGRDSKARIEDYKIGFKNLTGILQEEGKTRTQHYNERCAEIVEREEIKAEWEKRTGIQIDSREMQMLTPNDPAETEETITTQDNDTE